MSKMRRLLRKLHIGARQSSPEYPSSPLAPAVTTLDSPTDLTSDGGDDSGNFRLLEEEYQFQLALAISASGTDPTEGPMPGPDSVQPVECLSLQYWNYNVVNYDEKVTDGFYDVYGISSNANMQGKMPSLADLQVIPHSDRTDYEVVVVNRAVDPELQQLERRAISIALDCQTPEHGPTVYDLVQKIADLVVGSMGGPVCDVNDILRRWTTWSYELQTSLDSIVFPLGCLEVGLSSHRALLFKVLADKINLPCRLVKGSYYTGTDDGAVNLIKLDQGSEYIVDLMGAPGTLIPAEIPHSHLQSSGSGVLSSSIIKQVVTDLSVPCDNSEYIVDLMGAPGTLIPAEIPHSHLQNSGSDVLSSSIIKQVVNDLSVALDKKVNCQFGKNTGKLEGNLCEPRLVSTALGSGLGVVSGDDIHHAKRISWRFEHGFGKLIPSLSLANLHGRSSETDETLSAEKKRAQDVSEYIMSVSQKPEFTDKLHAILLDREASQTPDLLSDLNPPLDLFDAKTLDQTCSNEGSKMDQEPEVANFLFPLSKFKSSMLADCGKRRQKFAAPITWSQGFENSSPNSSSMNKLGFDCADLHFPVDPVVSPIVSFPCMGASEWFVRADSMSSGGVDSAPNHRSSTVITRMYGRQVQESSRYTERIKSSTKQCQEEMKKCVETANSDLPNIGIGALSDRINLLFDDVAEWEVQCEDLQIGELIGLSSFGEVYRADWNDTEVVVKKFLDHDFSGDAVEQFRREITLMPRLRHPNIVLFMGAVSRPPNLTILTEFLPRGTLYGLLHRPNIQLNEKRRLRMALDVVKGMNYLHSSRPSIVHRDLKSPNLLVDKDWVVKVSDFGLARLQHHAFLPSNSAAGTPEWMAPEVLRNEPSSEKCDIYSFGVILWELATLRMPWSGMSPLQVVGAVGFQNRRLDIPEEVDPMVAQIISDCCHSDPNLRPSFAQLIAPVKHLKQLLSEIT